LFLKGDSFRAGGKQSMRIRAIATADPFRSAGATSANSIATKVLPMPVPVPSETGSRRGFGASGQNGLGHGKENPGAIRAAQA
jgi:hypothetical protein